MQVEWINTDEKGRVVIDGYLIKLKESEKYKYFKIAMKNYPRATAFTTVGIILLIAGILLAVGMVGRMEMISLAKIYDDWSTADYIKSSVVDLILLSVGAVSLRWGCKLSDIYDKWINDYFE